MMHIDITSPPHECFLFPCQNFFSSINYDFLLPSFYFLFHFFSFKYSLPQFSAGTILAAVYFHWTECLALNALHNARPPKHTHTKILHGSFIVNRWKHVMLENLLTSPKYEVGMKEATLMGTFLFQKAHKAR